MCTSTLASSCNNSPEFEAEDTEEGMYNNSQCFETQSEPSPFEKDRVVTFWDDQQRHTPFQSRLSANEEIRVTFTEQSLGLSLVLSQIRGDVDKKTIRRSCSEADIYSDSANQNTGRRLVVVDQTFPERGGGVAHAKLRPLDELIGIEQSIEYHTRCIDPQASVEPVVDVDVPGFEKLLTKLRSAPRPLTLIFSRPPVPTGKAGAVSPNPAMRKTVSLRRRDAIPTKHTKSRNLFGKSDSHESKTPKNKRRHFLLICHLIALAFTAFFRKLFCLFTPSSKRSSQKEHYQKAHPMTDSSCDSTRQPLLSSYEENKTESRFFWSHRRSASDPLQITDRFSIEQQQLNDLV